MQELDKDQLVSKLMATLSSYLKEKKCKLAYLVGSFARSLQLPMSDLDLVISYPKFEELESNEQFAFYSKIIDLVREVTQIDEIDISILEKLPTITQFSMLRDGIVIYEDQTGDAHNFIEKLMNQYYDLAMWYENLLDISLGVD